ncbi:MAG: protein-methionine-sulfoxide reductase catalytic subunit MsrP [Pelolinea sp.]|nr:protein-methionine-sulfoxide reductase catalytic subunit MsrP [Pelolinea sp.]
MSNKISLSEITSEEIYISRRRFMKNALQTTAASLLISSCSNNKNSTSQGDTPATIPDELMGSFSDENGPPATTYEDILNYTNYHEFSADKSRPTYLAQGFITSPWSVKVGGFVNNPREFGIDEIRNLFKQEERVYRMRCVEAWSMVIPWIGFPLKKLLEIVEPTSDAKYVRFETVFRPEQMPGQSNPSYPWPYVEGLRLDEAMHDLTLLATGLYGKDLTPQNGAPLRLVVPWKYGFKSIKSIVKNDLVSEMPTSLWMATGPNEYGFFANVNPFVDHPRWSQATERRIGAAGRINTELYNGYEEDAADLYNGMDLAVYY